jgi:hypothetical protein
MLYKDADKNNSRLKCRIMELFRCFIQDLELDELYLHGHLYTWSNEQRLPTMARNDRAFACIVWCEIDLP